MNWLIDIPLEIRLKVYTLVAQDALVEVRCQSEPGEQSSEHLGQPTSNSVLRSLGLTCRTVKAEFEPLYFRFARFVSKDSIEPVTIFRSHEKRTLASFIDPSSIQFQIYFDQLHQREPTKSHSLLARKSRKFTITDTIYAYHPDGFSETMKLCKLLQFCHERVWELQFNFKPNIRSQTVRCTADLLTNFTFSGRYRRDCEDAQYVLLSHLEHYQKYQNNTNFLELEQPKCKILEKQEIPLEELVAEDIHTRPAVDKLTGRPTRIRGTPEEQQAWDDLVERNQR